MTTLKFVLVKAAVFASVFAIVRALLNAIAPKHPAK